MLTEIMALVTKLSLLISGVSCKEGVPSKVLPCLCYLPSSMAIEGPKRQIPVNVIWKELSFIINIVN